MPRYTATVTHELGRDEALSRLKAATARARNLADLKGDWEGGVLDFSATLQGLRIAGRLAVEDGRLTFDGTLPLLAMPFRSWIPRMLRKGLEAPVRESAAPEPVESPAVLFLHIPKAGGQTLGELVYANTRSATAGSDGDGLFKDGVAYLGYGFLKERPLEVPGHVLPLLRREDLRAVIGHFWFGLHEHVARPSVYVTALRDPVERVLSLYYYLRLQDSMTLDRFVAEPPFPEVDNDQTRRIAGADPEVGGCTPALLEAARENLRRRFAVAGTIERLDELAVLLQRKLGWRGPMEWQPRNVNPDRPAAASLPRATVEAIRRRNELDFELWRYASERMDEELRTA